ncbi:HNH endonuclease [Paenimyroides ceti]
MIKLDLPDCPSKLTVSLKNKLVNDFIESGKKKIVWSLPWLRIAISEMAYGKCCFSEIKFGEESKYMEIEHFLPKKLYPEFVVEWGNLLPSCKTCNVSKSLHDPLSEDIINPFYDNPKEHLRFKTFRLVPKDDKGKKTISVLNLNDFEQFVKKRFEICNYITENLEDIYDAFSISSNSYNKKVNRLRALMQNGSRREEYSSIISTTILTDENYQNIKSYLSNINRWDLDFIDKEKELQYCSLID